VLRGFSMGGHGAWHVGLHYPHLWSAVSPGAGFTDTRRYLRITESLPDYQERAWHIYDAVDYALNLLNTPFVAYGGEKDPQLQASLNMKDAATRLGLPLNLVVGPNTEHAYHPESFREILGQLEAQSRPAALPKQRAFETWSLKYNQGVGITVDALRDHYRRASVRVREETDRLTVTTENVEGLTLPWPRTVTSVVEIDGQTLRAGLGEAVRLARKAAGWRLKRVPAAADPESGPGPLKFAGEAAERPWRNHPPRKRAGLQGPIDDAFSGSFLAVRGAGAPWNPTAQAYADAALRRFQDEWRFGFRGEVPIRDAAAVTAADYRRANLVLFGDPGSNPVLARILPKLPLRWTRQGICIGGQTFESDRVPVLIYPNPLNPKRYVVLNSGHTFAEKDLIASNAYLFPRLGDWAVLKPSRTGAEVLAAGFFDERWRWYRSVIRDASFVIPNRSRTQQVR
jgi:hypothetical protein